MRKEAALRQARMMASELRNTFPAIAWKESVKPKDETNTKWLWSVIADHFEVREIKRDEMYVCHISHSAWENGHTNKTLSNEGIPNGNTATDAVKTAFRHIEQTISTWSRIAQGQTTELSIAEDGR